LQFQQIYNKISCTIDTLQYYSIIAFEYGNVSVIKPLPHGFKNATGNKSFINLLGRFIPAEQKCISRKKTAVSSGIYITDKKHFDLVK
jgi:hypothetical protein